VSDFFGLTNQNFVHFTHHFTYFEVSRFQKIGVRGYSALLKITEFMRYVTYYNMKKFVFLLQGVILVHNLLHCKRNGHIE
jgi:hypothetical protein